MTDARNLRAELDLPATDAAERLSAIAVGLASGEVGLATAGRSHLLRPGPDVRMELDASQGEHDGRLTIGLIWKNYLGYGLAEWLEQSSDGLAAEIQPEPYDTDGGGFLMPGNDQSFDFSTRSDPNQTAEYLERIARYIRAGLVRLSSGAESIDLAVAGDVKLVIAAESRHEKGRGSLRIELSWKPAVVKEEPHIVIEGADEGTAPWAAPADGARATG